MVQTVPTGKMTPSTEEHERKGFLFQTLVSFSTRREPSINRELKLLESA